MEPNLNPEVKGGLFIPRESIIEKCSKITGKVER